MWANTHPLVSSLLYNYIMARMLAHSYRLVKNSYQIQNQRLRFTQELTNDLRIVCALAEIKFTTRCIFIPIRYGIFETLRVHNSETT